MSLTTVTQFRVRPEHIRAFERGVRRIAERAASESETRLWVTYRVRYGALGKYYLLLPTPEWASQGAIDPIDKFAERLFGEEEGSRIIDGLWDCIEGAYRFVRELRPELSAPDETRDDLEAPMVALTRFSPTPDGWTALEALYTRLREAVFKLDDRRRYSVHQTRLGDLNELWEVIPLDDMAQFDGWRTREELLAQAFGVEASENIYGAFVRSLREAEREICLLRTDLSHVPRPARD